MNQILEKLLRQPLNRHLGAAVALSLALLCVYQPVLRSTYFYHDDWIHLMGRGLACDAFPMYSWHKTMGRPLTNDLYCWLYTACKTADTAWVARFAIVIGIAVFAFLQSVYFQVLGLSWITSVSLAFGASVLPGMLVSAYWIAAACVVFSLIPSVAAAIFIYKALEPSRTAIGRVSLIALSCACQVASLLVYQTGAMYLWTLLAVLLATQLPKGLKTTLWRATVYTLVGAGTTAGYFTWFKYISGYAKALSQQDPTRSISFDGAGVTVHWFFYSALPRASTLWFVDASAKLGIALLALLLCCLILLSVRMGIVRWRQRDRLGSLLCLLYPLAIGMLGLLAFSPMLVTGFHFEAFRTLVPLSACIFLTGALHLGMALDAARWRPAIKLALAAGFVFGLSSLTTNLINGRMVLPAATEYSFVRASLLRAARQGRDLSNVHAIVPVATTDLRTDEFDKLSCERVQDIGPMISVMERELGLTPGPATYSFRGQPFQSEGALVLDFAELAKSGLWKSVAEGGANAKPNPKPAPLSEPVGIDRQAPDPADPLPRLRGSYGRYNLVAFRGRIYGVPKSAGALGLEVWQQGKVDNLPGVIRGASVDEVIKQLP